MWEVDELPSTSSFNIISISKRHFARYGIRDEVISDNAAQITSEEFAAFREVVGIFTQRIIALLQQVKRKS